MIMALGDGEADELEKLLADVLRTIRENDQFIRNLKEEASDPIDADAEEDPVADAVEESVEYEEL